MLEDTKAETEQVEAEIFAMLAVIMRLLDKRNELGSMARCREAIERIEQKR